MNIVLYGTSPLRQPLNIFDDVLHILRVLAPGQLRGFGNVFSLPVRLLLELPVSSPRPLHEIITVMFCVFAEKAQTKTLAKIRFTTNLHIKETAHTLKAKPFRS